MLKSDKAVDNLGLFARPDGRPDDHMKQLWDTFTHILGISLLVTGINDTFCYNVNVFKYKKPLFFNDSIRQEYKLRFT